ncbi:Fructosamine kinase-domain-containing protein [Apiospora arundinis]|uniref:protein-ribulosamine 3-kinase n=1 Tax=Apiospora arundinis TaxID=335852 RepID=A0ABR2ISS7_9PEZI
MPDVPDRSDGYVPPPRTGPNPLDLVDPNVKAKLPTGSQILSITPHGSSFWTQTARLETTLADGTPNDFFLKTAEGDNGRGMISGEFESMSLLFRISPGLVPKPVAWGTYQDMPQFHFFLCDFHDMTEELPPVEEFTASIARLHKASIPLSPGKFGFPVTTYQGPIAQDNSWCDTWEEFFRQGMVRMLQREEDVHGPDPELSVLCEQLYDKVIPRLLRPLTVLKSIAPVLVHGDLWYGNVCTDNATGKPIVFDACVFWAHNEYEVGTWRAPRYRFGKSYIEAYQKHFAISEPTEDHDDRNALYSIRYDLHSSIAYRSSLRFRRDAMNTMKYLTDKFPRGYEEWHEEYEISRREAGSDINSADVALS